MMVHVSYRLYRLATALGHGAARRLTKGGLLTATGLILVGTIGSDLDQSVAFQAFALLLSLLVLAMIRAPFFRGKFTIHRRLPRMATVHQPFRYRVEVRNLSDSTYRDLELLEYFADPRPSLEEFSQSLRPVARIRAFRLAPQSGPGLDFRNALSKPAVLAALGARGVGEAQLEVVPLRRGPLRLPGMTVARRDPFGLFRGLVRVTQPETVLILPKRYSLPPLALSGTRNYQPGGVALASSIGESEEFVSLRDYRPGDPFRRIHSRSWARAGHPIVKEYQDEFFARHALVLDTFTGDCGAHAFEEAVSVAASFACTLESQESLLDLLFVGCQAFRFTAGRGLGQSEQMLEILASVRANPKRSFDGLMELVLQHASVLSACLCVLLAWDEPRRELVRQLRALRLPVLAMVIADQATERTIRRDFPGEIGSRLHLLRVDRIEEDLQSLGGLSL
jgi:uncharacterized protein (DUF58 family)